MKNHYLSQSPSHGAKQFGMDASVRGHVQSTARNAVTAANLMIAVSG